MGFQIIIEMRVLPHLQDIERSMRVLSGFTESHAFQWIYDLLFHIELGSHMSLKKWDLEGIDWHHLATCKPSFKVLQTISHPRL